jgi:site-specific recombinase XerD
MIDNFLIAGRAQGWSAATVKQYAKHLQYWQAWLTGADPTPDNLIAWLAAIRGRWSPATVRSAVIAVRSYLRFTGRADLAQAIKPPQPPPRVQRTISASEVGRLLEAADARVVTGVSPAQADAVALRNAAIVAVLYDCWLRASELCSLTLDAVSVEARRLIVAGKGNREELVAYSAETALRLHEWLTVRPTVANRGVRALFVAVGGSTPGQPLTVQGLRAILNSLGRRAGVDNVTPHSFRRGGATQAIRNGASTRWVQAHGRWAKLEFVELYTRALDPGDLIERYSPVAHLTRKRAPVPVHRWEDGR